jgi:tetratricopeptide (TPR) repeat protein
MINNKQGRSEDAAKNLEKALSLKKNFPAANFELGVAYSSLGKTEGAAKQLSILQSSGSPQAQDLQFIIEKPKMLYMDQDNHRNFNQILGPSTPLWMLDTSLFTPSSSTKVSVAIQFNNNMNVASVMDPNNWQISRASSTEGGFYISGAHEATVPVTPSFVSYNPDTNQASLTFTIKQNAEGNATIDPSHLVFKFSGKDAAGRSMDTSADQIDGSVIKPF